MFSGSNDDTKPTDLLVFPQSPPRKLLRNQEPVVETYPQDSQAAVSSSWCFKLRQCLIIKNVYVRMGLSEFLGTMILMAMGTGIVAQTVLSQKLDMPHGSFITIGVGWAVAVMCGIFASSCSGGHINPAVSIVHTMLGNLSLKKLPAYLLGQFMGAFCGAAIAYFTYYEAIQQYTAPCNHTYTITGPCATAAIFSTYPQEFLTNWQGFVDQIVGTAFLMGMALAITDKKNAGVPPYLAPLMIGLLVCGILTGYEFNCGASLNPARDLGPRMFTAVAGWGTEVFTYRDYWFVIPTLGPVVGAMVGALFYVGLVGLHLPEVQ